MPVPLVALASSMEVEDEGSVRFHHDPEISRRPSARFSRSASPTIPSSSHQSNKQQSSVYQFGDGNQGYKVVFPEETPEHAAERIAWHVRCASLLSLLVNFSLLVVLLYSAIASRSLSVAASALDSFFDLLSQFIVEYAERRSKRHDPALYPAGRTRMEPLGQIGAAALMAMAAVLLIDESSRTLADGYGPNSTGHAEVDFSIFILCLLGFNIVSKLGLYVYCKAFAEHSSALVVLAEDHRNDVASNCVALAAGLIAWKWDAAWSIDAIGAIVMSVWICFNWASVAYETADQLIGRSAEPEFMESLRHLTDNFHPIMRADQVKAYHFGSNYLVELEVVLPELMTVREAHDISLALQQSVEQLPKVERAFVHVDWKGRDGEDEHNSTAIAAKWKRLNDSESDGAQLAADLVAVEMAANPVMEPDGPVLPTTQPQASGSAESQ